MRFGYPDGLVFVECVHFGYPSGYEVQCARRPAYETTAEIAVLSPHCALSRYPVPEVWCFDLDGCLVDSMAGTHLRPFARELLTELIARDVDVRIWSAGGAEYSERVAARVGIGDLISSYHFKERGADGKWGLPPLPSGAGVVCVDDQPEGVPDHVRTIRVFPYLGPRPHDQALAKVLAQLDPKRHDQHTP